MKVFCVCVKELCDKIVAGNVVRESGVCVTKLLVTMLCFVIPMYNSTFRGGW